MSGEDSSEMEAYKREATKRLAKIEKFDTVNLSVMQVAEECLKATIADKQLDMAFAGSFMAYVFHMPRIEAFDSIVEILNRITQSAVFNMGISVAKSIVSSSMREPYAKKVKRTSAFLSRCICKLLDGDGGENKRSDLVIKYIRREDFIDKLKKFSSFAVDELVQSVAHLPSDAGFLNVYPDCFRDPTDCFRDPTDGTIFEQRWAIKSAFKNLTVENSRTISKTRKDRKQDVRNSLPAAIGNVAPNTHDNRKEGGSDLHHGNRIHSESEHLPQRTIVFSGGSGDVQERSPGARDRSDSRDRTRRDSDRLQHSGHSARGRSDSRDRTRRDSDRLQHPGHSARGRSGSRDRTRRANPSHSFVSRHPIQSGYNRRVRPYDSAGNELCINFLRGRCVRDSNCKFKHGTTYTPL